MREKKNHDASSMNFFTIAGKYGQHGKFCTVLQKYLKKEEEKIASIFIEELLHYKEGLE